MAKSLGDAYSPFCEKNLAVKVIYNGSPEHHEIYGFAPDGKFQKKDFNFNFQHVIIALFFEPGDGTCVILAEIRAYMRNAVIYISFFDSAYKVSSEELPQGLSRSAIFEAFLTGYMRACQVKGFAMFSLWAKAQPGPDSPYVYPNKCSSLRFNGTQWLVANTYSRMTKMAVDAGILPQGADLSTLGIGTGVTTFKELLKNSSHPEECNKLLFPGDPLGKMMIDGNRGPKIRGATGVDALESIVARLHAICPESVADQMGHLDDWLIWNLVSLTQGQIQELRRDLPEDPVDIDKHAYVKDPVAFLTRNRLSVRSLLEATITTNIILQLVMRTCTKAYLPQCHACGGRLSERYLQECSFHHLKSKKCEWVVCGSDSCALKHYQKTFHHLDTKKMEKPEGIASVAASKALFLHIADCGLESNCTYPLCVDVCRALKDPDNEEHFAATIRHALCCKVPADAICPLSKECSRFKSAADFDDIKRTFYMTNDADDTF